MRFKSGTATCKDYCALIQDVIDNRSTREQEVYLERHIKSCLKCLNKLNLEKELKQAIKHKLLYQEVPVGLADSIREKISD